MQCFDVVASVLTSLMPQVFGHAEMTDTDGAAVRERLEKMSNLWRNGKSPALKSSKARFAYTYCYVPAHAYLAQMAFGRCPDIYQYLQRASEAGITTKICAIGGGPATEIIGIAKCLRLLLPKESAAKLQFTVLDYVAEWTENCEIVGQIVNKMLSDEGYSFEIGIEFKEFDVRAKIDSGSDPISGYDIYLFNHVISELAGSPEKLTELVVRIANSLPEHGVVVMLDRHELKIEELCKGLLSHGGLMQVCINYEKKIEMAEDSEVLAPFKAKIQRSARTCYGRPDLNQGAFWIVGKRELEE